MDRELELSVEAFCAQVDQIYRTAAPKTKMSRKQMAKNLEKSKAKFKHLKDALEVMEADDARLKNKLEQTRGALDSERQSIIKTHEALQKMDLADVDDAVFYDDDIGYLINGKECHLEIGSNGHLVIIPMSQYKKNKKEEAKALETPVEVEVEVESPKDDGIDEEALLELLNSL